MEFFKLFNLFGGMLVIFGGKSALNIFSSRLIEKIGGIDKSLE